MTACFEVAAEKQGRTGEARRAAAKPQPRVPLRTKTDAFADKHHGPRLRGGEKDGKRVATDKPKDYALEYVGRVEPTRGRGAAVRVPVPAREYPTAVETLQRHGIEVEELREDIELDVEAYTRRRRSTRADRRSRSTRSSRST